MFSFALYVCIILGTVQICVSLKGISCTTANSRCRNRPSSLRAASSSSGNGIPTPIPPAIAFRPEDIEIIRVLGKIDVVVEDERITSMRLFEAILPSGQRVYLKEYLQEGDSFGKREYKATRKLTKDFNANLYASNEEKEKGDINIDDSSSCNNNDNDNAPIGANDNAGEGGRDKSNNRSNNRKSNPPFPILLGHLRTDERIADPAFTALWSRRFPGIRPPGAGA